MFSSAIRSLAIAGALALSANAQLSVGPCVDPCVQAALGPNTCSSVQDIQCLCTNGAFQSAVSNCLGTAGCSSDEINALVAAQAANCN